MTEYCRLCAELKDTCEFVTSIDDSEKLIHQKLVACCQWNVEITGTKLPQNVCVFCLDKLDKCCLFSRNVQLAQQKLLEIFENKAEVKSTILKPASESTPPSGTERHDVTFDCDVCSKIFSSRTALDGHDCHSGPKLWPCNKCQKKFKTSAVLLAHRKRQKQFECDECSHLFCNSKMLNMHKMRSCKTGIDETVDAPESKPAFVDCDTVLESKVKNQNNEEHNASIELDLDIDKPTDSKCNNRMRETTYSLLSPESVESQIDLGIRIIKKSKKPTKKKRFKRFEYATEESQANDDEDTNYFCYLCNRRFKKFPLLRGHMMVHTLPNKYKCQYCNTRFRTERHYTSHQKNHIDYFCDTCNKKCRSAFALKVHKRMHVGASVKMYGCKECDHFFADVSTYYNHMKRKHAAKPYVCEQCGKDFLERSSLQSHLVVHFDIRPYKCDICPKAFKNKYNLKAHQETHTGEKSVQCSECGKTYSRKSVLLKHMEEHTGVYSKIFQCDFCDRIFRYSYNMQNHRRTHTGEKPYRCDVCKYDVTTKSQLDRHLKTMSHMNRLRTNDLQIY